MTRATEATPLTNEQLEAANKLSLFYKMFTLLLTGGAIGMIVYGATWKESPLLGGPDCSNSLILGQYEPCDTTLPCEAAGNTPSWLGFTQPQLLALCMANMCKLSNAHLFWTWATGSDKGLKTSCPDNATVPMIATVAGAAILLVMLVASYQMLCRNTASEHTTTAGNQQRLLPPPTITVVTSSTANDQPRLTGVN